MIGCSPPSAIAFREYCVNVYPDANLDPTKPGDAQAFCQDNMPNGQVLIYSNGRRYSMSVIFTTVTTTLVKMTFVITILVVDFCLIACLHYILLTP